MRAEIITIGDELLIGQVINANQAFIAEKLNTVGIYTERMTTIGDTEHSILESFAAAFTRSDVICVTGGLGPTHDDITKDVVCRFFATHLIMNDDALQKIIDLMERRGVKLSETSRNQALVPFGSTVIPNTAGSAPGFMIEKDGKYFFVMPGVPFEMKAMMEHWIVPFFEKKNIGVIVRHKTFKTTGIAESLLAQEVGPVSGIIGTDGTVTLAFLPNPMGTKMRITVREKSLSAAEEKLGHAESVIRSKVERYIYSSDEKELEDVVGELFRVNHLTLATAESCTGGLIAHRITNVPGSSDYFMRGFIVYSNESKIEELEVPPDLISSRGAVSKEVAVAMAEGARKTAGTSVAISITGIAGPGGGSEEKPVGTAFIGYADTESSFAVKFNFGDHRLRFKDRASQAALELLRRKILKVPVQ
ncbi:MAG: competence/damage-inducible protein A [Bacteroidota bacterium]|jgi:nicotinamide-nucleotide amidase